MPPRSTASLAPQKLNGIDPEAYLRYVLARIADHPINGIDEMLPWRVRPVPAAVSGFESCVSQVG